MVPTPSLALSPEGGGEARRLSVSRHPVTPGAFRSHSAATVALMSLNDALADFWRRGQRGWPADYPIVQFPNAPLLFALSAYLTAAVTVGTLHAYARAAFYAGLAAWAWAELASGDNGVRRALGLGGLLYVIMKVGIALGA